MPGFQGPAPGVLQAYSRLLSTFRSYVMTTTASRVTAVVLLTAAGSGSSQAEYRCDPPPTRIDRNACQAAAEGPRALRQYVQPMRWLTTIQFSDYVNERTIDAWEAMKREEGSG